MACNKKILIHILIMQRPMLPYYLFGFHPKKISDIEKMLIGVRVKR
jgi:hypothetical protein